MNMKYLLIALVISIISIGAVSASDNINMTASDVSDITNDDMEISEISLISNDVASADSIHVEDIGINKANNDYSGVALASEQPVAPTAYDLVNDIVPASLSITADFTKEINIDKFMNVANNHNDHKEPVDVKNNDNSNNTNETEESPLPETGIPVYALILVIFVAIGIYRKD